MLKFSVFFSLLTLALAQCWRDVACDGPTSVAFPGSWDSNIYASASRFVTPTNALTWPNLTATPWSNQTVLTGNGSLVTLDFGKEVGGIVNLNYTSDGSGSLGLAFAEAKDFVGESSDDSNGKFVGPDGAIYSNFTGGIMSYTMPDLSLRGGFRYLTLFLVSNQTEISTTVTNVTVELEFMPTWPDLTAYQGYFHSNDELLNRIWYAGAYTLQSNCVPTNTGRQVPFLNYGWANNASLGPGDTIIVDGAKRDRAVWPGDMGVAVPSTFVSLGDLESVMNALQVMYFTQNNVTGAFAESGPPLSQTGSDTYHMWSMVGTYNYVLYTGDLEFLSRNWNGYLRAMNYILGNVSPAPSGLLNVTGIRDWARLQQGFHNTEANTILYRTLLTGSSLATWMSDSKLVTNWTTQAEALKSAINAQLFDASYGAFKDNDTTTTLHPQDANSFAVLFNVTDSASKASNISSLLTQNWTPIGPVTPELPDNISPFITSFEIGAHLPAREPQRSLDLIRTTWGFIINNGNSTQSTLLEGYLANGSFGYRNYRGYDYDTSYVSHAHGWSSGPTSVLTTGILGLEVTDLAGKNWSLTPQFGDLTHVEGGFTTSLGKYSAQWERSASGDSYSVNWTVPANTSGTVTLPALQGGQTLELNGKDMESQGALSRAMVAEKEIVSFAVGGGQGTVEVR